MVGDWPERDLAGAKSVGMRAAFAKYGNLDAENLSGQVDVVLEDISEIVDYLKKVNSL